MYARKTFSSPAFVCVVVVVADGIGSGVVVFAHTGSHHRVVVNLNMRLAIIAVRRQKPVYGVGVCATFSLLYVCKRDCF